MICLSKCGTTQSICLISLVNNSSLRPTPIAFYNAHILSITGIKVGSLGLCYSSSLDGYFKVWNMFNVEKKCKLEIAIQTPITAFCIVYLILEP
jgi:hypothetical protein